MVVWIYTGPIQDIYGSWPLCSCYITAALELTVPYIAKQAVDKYIYPFLENSGRCLIMIIRKEINLWILKSRFPSLVLPLEDSSYLIDMSEIDNEDRHNLEKLGLVSDERYLAINQE